MVTEKTYSVSEIFTSPQGEGLFAGSLQTFVRLAGCSVGKPFTKENRPEGLPVYVETCHNHAGTAFLCDTDFRVKEKLTVSEIMSQVPKGVKHLCITGGEPLIHDLIPLAVAAKEKGMQLHIETSGTIHPPSELVDVEADMWVTVSPKLGVLSSMINYANEIKLLVDESFDETKIPPQVMVHPLVWVQPINGEHEISLENAQRCVALIRRHPTWRLSLQLHKILGCR